MSTVGPPNPADWQEIAEEIERLKSKPLPSPKEDVLIAIPLGKRPSIKDSGVSDEK